MTKFTNKFDQKNTRTTSPNKNSEDLDVTIKSPDHKETFGHTSKDIMSLQILALQDRKGSLFEDLEGGEPEVVKAPGNPVIL